MEKKYYNSKGNILTWRVNNQDKCNGGEASSVKPSVKKYSNKGKKYGFLLNRIFIISALVWTCQFFNEDSFEQCGHKVNPSNGSRDIIDLRAKRCLYEDIPFQTFNDNLTEDNVTKDNVINEDLMNSSLMNNDTLSENLKNSLCDATNEDANREKEKIKSILYSYMVKIDTMHEDKLFYKLFRKCRDENDENPMSFF
ncbi:conserved Plasmodium protein, unknown function [Plasmodium knowlesi strain H]|uniref:Uncharacterized protein n=3 Tax=Plasmodium knowlesi TaxID=5850 RepID=A0A5K1V3B9_PLAKH|nr:conserved Plasmodium protein, unknown function [Plasmodium knowlesi strain H]OTN68121.1 Uncharacterized protein PKNOH_S04340300 [Plasmodium knowlesi]CAA9990281.1 conserved Plasmodium protein, unknown function [Plasmodium knowlesi strain H]SBO26739.1 conserved Plasmodium protein, unknown function [Plasmodium knowlesi strain H]SBO28398.1 conserved Plasmodium protein, unknown function [Plasmodium knowlesi strain H]VVS79755.1 conserved Plasmodium protein, unknown function [Plasmodium knowlesi s|eukprot:XP_002258020.1 hypothetical protein, conserved in Plasmodium species [Plasmodium knowlesi strain H]